MQHVALTNQFKTVHGVAVNAETGFVETPKAQGGTRMPIDKNEQLLSLQITMKIADLGSTAEALEVSVKCNYFRAAVPSQTPPTLPACRRTSDGSACWR